MTQAAIWRMGWQGVNIALVVVQEKENVGLDSSCSSRFGELWLGFRVIWEVESTVLDLNGMWWVRKEEDCL